MAYEVDGVVKLPGHTASADLSAKQYYFVKLSGAGTVDVCSGVTDKPIGVLQNAPTSGDVAEVCVIGITKVNADASIAVGDFIGTSADGQAAPYVAGTDTTKYNCGTVLLAAGAAGRFGTAVVNCANPARFA
jgi:hypothetical protein